MKNQGLIIGIVAFMLIIIGIGAYLVLSKNNTQQNSTTTTNTGGGGNLLTSLIGLFSNQNSNNANQSSQNTNNSSSYDDTHTQWENDYYEQYGYYPV